VGVSRRTLLACLPALAAAGSDAAERGGPLTVQGDVREGLLFVQAAAGSAAGRFMIDTGAPVSCLDKAFADRAGVVGLSPEGVRGPGGMQQGWIAPPTLLTLAGGPRASVAPSVLDLSPVARRMGAELSGLIGSDFLSGFTTTIDYRTARVRFAPGATSPGVHAVAMRVGRTPYVSAAITYGAVHRTAEFQIDTGANTPVVFYRQFSSAAFPSIRSTPASQQGVAGVAQSQLGTINSLDIAGVQLLDLPADFADDLAPDDASRDYAGVIGGPAWRGRQITLDYPGRRFWIA